MELKPSDPRWIVGTPSGFTVGSYAPLRDAPLTQRKLSAKFYCRTG